jgi:hypothetical protein
MQHHDTVQRITDAANTAQYGGAGATVFFGITAELWGVIIGAIVAIAGFLVNVYYKRKFDAYKRAEHELRLQLMREGKFSSFGDEE